jgi:hypothetical protein
MLLQLVRDASARYANESQADSVRRLSHDGVTRHFRNLEDAIAERIAIAGCAFSCQRRVILTFAQILNELSTNHIVMKVDQDLDMGRRKLQISELGNFKQFKSQRIALAMIGGIINKLQNFHPEIGNIHTGHLQVQRQEGETMLLIGNLSQTPSRNNSLTQESMQWKAHHDFLTHQRKQMHHVARLLISAGTEATKALHDHQFTKGSTFMFKRLKRGQQRLHFHEAAKFYANHSDLHDLHCIHAKVQTDEEIESLGYNMREHAMLEAEHSTTLCPAALIAHLPFRRISRSSEPLMRQHAELQEQLQDVLIALGNVADPWLTTIHDDIKGMYRSEDSFMPNLYLHSLHRVHTEIAILIKVQHVCSSMRPTVRATAADFIVRSARESRLPMQYQQHLAERLGQCERFRQQSHKAVYKHLSQLDIQETSYGRGEHDIELDFDKVDQLVAARFLSLKDRRRLLVSATYGIDTWQFGIGGTFDERKLWGDKKYGAAEMYVTVSAVAEVDKKEFETTTNLEYIIGGGFFLYIAGYQFTVFEARTAFTTDPITSNFADNEMAQDLLRQMEEVEGGDYRDTDLADSLSEKILKELQTLYRTLNSTHDSLAIFNDELKDLQQDFRAFLEDDLPLLEDTARSLQVTLDAATRAIALTNVSGDFYDRGMSFDLTNGIDTGANALRIVLLDVVETILLTENHSYPALKTATEAVLLSLTETPVERTVDAIQELLQAENIAPSATETCYEDIASYQQLIDTMDNIVDNAASESVGTALNSTLNFPLRNEDILALIDFETAKSGAANALAALSEIDLSIVTAAETLTQIGNDKAVFAEAGDYLSVLELLTGSIVNSTKSTITGWLATVAILRANLAAAKLFDDESDALERIVSYVDSASLLNEMLMEEADIITYSDMQATTNALLTTCVISSVPITGNAHCKEVANTVITDSLADALAMCENMVNGTCTGVMFDNSGFQDATYAADNTYQLCVGDITNDEAHANSSAYTRDCLSQLPFGLKEFTERCNIPHVRDENHNLDDTNETNNLPIMMKVAVSVQEGSLIVGIASDLESSTRSLSYDDELDLQCNDDIIGDIMQNANADADIVGFLASVHHAVATLLAHPIPSLLDAGYSENVTAEEFYLFHHEFIVPLWEGLVQSYTNGSIDQNGIDDYISRLTFQSSRLATLHDLAESHLDLESLLNITGDTIEHLQHFSSMGANVDEIIFAWDATCQTTGNDNLLDNFSTSIFEMTKVVREQLVEIQLSQFTDQDLARGGDKVDVTGGSSYFVEDHFPRVARKVSNLVRDKALEISEFLNVTNVVTDTVVPITEQLVTLAASLPNFLAYLQSVQADLEVLSGEPNVIQTTRDALVAFDIACSNLPEDFFIPNLDITATAWAKPMQTLCNTLSRQTPTMDTLIAFVSMMDELTAKAESALLEEASDITLCESTANAALRANWSSLEASLLALILPKAHENEFDIGFSTPAFLDTLVSVTEAISNLEEAQMATVDAAEAARFLDKVNASIAVATLQKDAEELLETLEILMEYLHDVQSLLQKSKDEYMIMNNLLTNTATSNTVGTELERFFYAYQASVQTLGAVLPTSDGLATLNEYAQLRVMDVTVSYGESMTVLLELAKSLLSPVTALWHRVRFWQTFKLGFRMFLRILQQTDFVMP